jgi:3-oxoacyl-[acyl-carrier-protein] synthase II
MTEKSDVIKREENMRRVVVTGMGVVSPVGTGVKKFWDNLISGYCGISEITRFDTTNFKVKVAAEVRDFDATSYLEKSQLRKTDLFCQYALAAAQMAVEDSKLTLPDSAEVLPDRLGVYIGSGIGGMNTFVRESIKLEEGGPNTVSPFFVPMMIGNMASGTVAIRYNARGPCLPVVTACATGGHSIGEAYLAIRYDRADMILAGGCEASLNALSVAGFTNCMALTKRNDPKSASIPFDKRRDGFVVAEGAGVIVLEEYEHARKRNAPIYGEITGYGNTCDAYHITAPDPEAAGSSRSIQIALEETFRGDPEYQNLVESECKIYINAHGTSTPLNDKTETYAIKKALGEEMAYRVMVSSTKSMTGHMLGAAGAVEVIACLKTLCEDIVPPTIGYEVADEECDLDYVPNQARQVKVDLALSTSLGFGGHNACIAIRPARLI